MDSTLFFSRLAEYAAALKETFPEYIAQVDEFMSKPDTEKLALYREEVVVKHTLTESLGCPGAILPGITLTQDTWKELSETTHRAIYDFLSLLDLCAMLSGVGEEGGSQQFTQEWADKVMRDWRARMSRVDFDDMSKRLFNMFGKQGENLPPIPEKFLKGKLAKLAEEMVREFKPEDFGLKAEDIEAVEKDPTRAFEILMGAATSNPDLLQRAIARVGKKLQEKVQRGQLNPRELAAEAEEMIREFQSNSSFVDMMKGFRDAFSFEDPDLARESGHDGEGRLSQARARLRAKLEKKKGKSSK
jgi:hypothetical protein